MFRDSTHPGLFLFFFLNDPAPTEIYPLPLHAPLPISKCDALLATEHRLKRLEAHNDVVMCHAERAADRGRGDRVIGVVDACQGQRHIKLVTVGIRSEEHTSELQSQSNLVCRLLLEKKK